jgi:hypothetical protein
LQFTVTRSSAAAQQHRTAQNPAGCFHRAEHRVGCSFQSIAYDLRNYVARGRNQERLTGFSTLPGRQSG